MRITPTPSCRHGFRSVLRTGWHSHDDLQNGERHHTQPKHAYIFPGSTHTESPRAQTGEHKRLIDRGVILMGGYRLPTQAHRRLHFLSDVLFSFLRLQTSGLDIFHEITEEHTKYPTSFLTKQWYQLTMLVTLNWSDTLSAWLKMKSIDPDEMDSGWYWWTRAFDIACFHAHEDALRSLFAFHFPVENHVNGKRLRPNLNGRGEHMLHILATGRPEGMVFRNLLDHLTPGVIGILRSYFGDGDLSMPGGLNGNIPLHYAIMCSNPALARSIIQWTPQPERHKLVTFVDAIGLTSLHYACCKGLVDVAKLCVGEGADVNLMSTNSNYGTPLHLACEHSQFVGSASLIQFLIKEHTDVNARRVQDVTPLHLVADTGAPRAILRCVLSAISDRRDMNPEDDMGRTPMMLVQHRNTMREFAPWHRSKSWRPFPKVCEGYIATWCEWGETMPFNVVFERQTFHGKSCEFSIRVPMRKLLYDEKDQTVSRRIDADGLRWIHLPANNIEWCDELLTRWVLEGEGDGDMEGLKAARRAFDLEHPTAGEAFKGRFLRPGVKVSHPAYNSPDSSAASHRPSQGGIPVVSQSSTHSVGFEKSPKQRHIFIAAPYLHFETNWNIKQMKQTLQARSSVVSETSRPDCMDERLYAAFANDPGFHPRRTLDQYLYHNMDTGARDFDQVVQRYQYKANDAVANAKSEGRSGSTVSLGDRDDVTAMMVDQMWIWILGDSLVITSLPQRWNGPQSDPYDTFESLRESVFTCSLELDRPKTGNDIAMLMMMHCFGTFDRHARRKPELQFMYMFEQTIGEIGAKESILLRDFAKAYQALAEEDSSQLLALDNPTDDVVKFIKQLNDLTLETKLLAELKDVRDELSIIDSILKDQQRVSDELRNVQRKLTRRGLPPLFKPTSSGVNTDDHDDSFEALNAILDQSFQDVARMDAQAARFSQSLSELLELKQAHSNAFELRVSRTLSLNAAKQSRAVLIFTIVTIVFSPLSFVAAFFTMNLTNLPEDMTLSHVSKYVFGLGFAVAIPCIALAFSASEISPWWTRVRDHVARYWKDGRSRLATSSDSTDTGDDEVKEKTSSAGATNQIPSSRVGSSDEDHVLSSGTAYDGNAASTTMKKKWGKNRFSRAQGASLLPQ